MEAGKKAAASVLALQAKGVTHLAANTTQSFTADALATDTPVQMKDLHATILTALGLRHEELFFEVNARQERLTGIAGGAKVVPGVLG